MKKKEKGWNNPPSSKGGLRMKCIEYLKRECKKCGLCYHVEKKGLWCRKRFIGECDGCGECYKYH